jgi:hypothetical protein
MKTAGVLIDFYDDPSGTVLKSYYPAKEDLPDAIKTAHILSSDELGVLRNDAFALVLKNEGKILRKFACVDAGNALLSALYFDKTAELLPEQARQVAANNIGAAMERFGFKVPAFLKIASKKADPMARVRDPVKRGSPNIDDGDWYQRTNLGNSLAGSGGRVKEVSDSLTITKSAGALGKARYAARAAARDPKVQAALRIAPNNPRQAAETFRRAVEKKDGKSKKATITKISEVVDVTGKEPALVIEKHSSERTALRGRYPLDAYGDVQEAVRYFDDYWPEFSPEDRHEYAVKTAARASELGIPYSDLMRRYGSEEYAPDIEAHVAARRLNLAPDSPFQEVYTDLLEKQASLKPVEFAELLSEADEAAGLAREWGGKVSDPYYATFGGPSEAEKRAAWEWSDGDLSVNAQQLAELTSAGRERLTQTFDHSFTSSFCKDPVTIFESMPDPHKAIIARLANE